MVMLHRPINRPSLPSIRRAHVDVRYALAGNRTQATLDEDADGTADRTTTYTHDANDRLLSESLDSDGDGMIDRTTTYSYSVTEQTNKTVWQGTDTTATGTKISETTYTYNLQGRVSKVQIDTNADDVAETTTIYAYDDNGVRVEQTVTEGGTTTTTEYLIDPQNDTGHSKQIEEPGAPGRPARGQTRGGRAGAVRTLPRRTRDKHAQPSRGTIHRARDARTAPARCTGLSPAAYDRPVAPGFQPLNKRKSLRQFDCWTLPVIRATLPERGTLHLRQRR